MTIHFPDVSNYQRGLSLAGAPACIAKATEGTWFRDSTYTDFKAQAMAMGIPFCAYHWLHAADVPGQARLAFSVVGPNVPLMIDDEDTTDGLDLNRTLAFVREYRALGGTVTLEYLPQWFWAQHGRPDLTPLTDAGLSLISSNYTVYSDTGPGWNPYGGVAPTVWQYTSTQPFNGMACDFNAFKGTVDELRALFTGEDDFMATIDQADWDALIYRVEAIIENRDAVAGGPTQGHPNKLAEKLAELEAKVDALNVGGGPHTHMLPAGQTGPAQP